MSDDHLQEISVLFDEFIDLTAEESRKRGLRRAMVRSQLTCSLIIVLDKVNLWVAAQKQVGMPSTISLDHRDKVFPIQEILNAARWEFGFEQPFVIVFPADLLNQTPEIRKAALSAIASSHVESEFQRVQNEMSVIQINPIFGPASYQLDERLAFVLMPFTDELTEIYKLFIKPTVEAPQFSLVCKRADDIKSNSTLMQDIWKSICEARLIIADLSNLNPNVMYELGMAHTLGKDTILIYQHSEQPIKFPFDLAHIRRIEYVNNAAGGRKLEQDLKDTLDHVLSPRIRA